MTIPTSNGSGCGTGTGHEHEGDEMVQQYKAKRFAGTSAERTAVMVDTAHLLNKLRTCADECGVKLTDREEEAFWKFISLLPAAAQSSVIN